MTESRISIVNVHSDNYGDFLNARTTEWAVSNLMAGASGPNLYSANLWQTPVDLGDSLTERTLWPFRYRSLDVARHVYSIEHKCPNALIWEECHDLLSSSELVLSVPCGANLGPYRDSAFLIPFLAARDSATPSAMFFGTVHPSGARGFDEMALNVLSRSYLTVRDRTSLDYLKANDLDAKGGVDVTALLAQKLCQEHASRPRRPVISLILGEPLRWHPEWARLQQGTSALLRGLRGTSIDDGISIELIPHGPLKGETEYLSEVALTFKHWRPVTVRDDITSLEDYIEAIATSSLVVSSRYHGAIVALASSTPVIPVCYEPKLSDLVEICGIAEHSLRLETITPESVTHLVSLCLESSPVAEFGQVIEKAQHLLSEAVEDLERLILKQTRLGRPSTAPGHHSSEPVVNGLRDEPSHRIWRWTWLIRSLVRDKVLEGAVYSQATPWRQLKDFRRSLLGFMSSSRYPFRRVGS